MMNVNDSHLRRTKIVFLFQFFLPHHCRFLYFFLLRPDSEEKKIITTWMLNFWLNIMFNDIKWFIFYLVIFDYLLFCLFLKKFAMKCIIQFERLKISRDCTFHAPKLASAPTMKLSGYAEAMSYAVLVVVCHDYAKKSTLKQQILLKAHTKFAYIRTHTLARNSDTFQTILYISPFGIGWNVICSSSKARASFQIQYLYFNVRTEIVLKNRKSFYIFN